MFIFETVFISEQIAEIKLEITVTILYQYLFLKKAFHGGTNFFW